MGILATNEIVMLVALPLVVVVGVVLAVRPVIGLYLMAGVVPLEAALMVGGASAPRLIGMAVFGTWAMQKLLRREPLGPLMAPGLVRAALLLLTVACLSVFWAEYLDGVNRHLFLLVQLILLTVLVFDLARSWDRVAWVAKFLVLGATVAALITLEQYFFGGERRAGGGVVGGINRTAMTLVIILPFAFYLLRSGETAFWRWLGLGYIGIAGLAVAATLSRMNYLVFPMVVAVQLALMTQTRRGRRRMLLLGAAAVIAVSFMPMDVIRGRAESIVPYLTSTVARENPGDTYSARGFMMQVSLAMFIDRPILGAGYRNYMPHFMNYQEMVPGAWRMYTSGMSPHGSHQGFLAELGIVGTLLWLTLFVVAARNLKSAWRTARDPTSVQALLTQTVAIAVGLLFLYGFYENVHTDKVLWIILGLVVAVHRLAKSEQAPGHVAVQPDVIRVPEKDLAPIS